MDGRRPVPHDVEHAVRPPRPRARRGAPSPASERMVQIGEALAQEPVAVRADRAPEDRSTNSGTTSARPRGAAAAQGGRDPQVAREQDDAADASTVGPPERERGLRTDASFSRAGTGLGAGPGYARASWAAAASDGRSRRCGASRSTSSTSWFVIAALYVWTGLRGPHAPVRRSGRGPRRSRSLAARALLRQRAAARGRPRGHGASARPARLGHHARVLGRRDRDEGERQRPARGVPRRLRRAGHHPACSPASSGSRETVDERARRRDVRTPRLAQPDLRRLQRAARIPARRRTHAARRRRGASPAAAGRRCASPATAASASASLLGAAAVWIFAEGRDGMVHLPGLRGA